MQLTNASARVYFLLVHGIATTSTEREYCTLDCTLNQNYEDAWACASLLASLLARLSSFFIQLMIWLSASAFANF